jgi:hypothetical protein
MFNFGNKKIDDLTSEVIRLNTVVTFMMKEISLLKQTINDKSTQAEQNMFSHQENMNSISNASNYKSTTSAPSSKSSLKSYITGRDNTYDNNAVIIAASMNDTTPSKCSTYSTTYAATSFPDHSHSSSSHSSSYDSSSSDCGSSD